MSVPFDAAPRSAWLAAHQRLLSAKARAAPVPGWLEHTMAVTDTIHAIAVHYDAGDVDEMVSLFERDATYTSFLGSSHGREALRAMFGRLVHRYRRTCHFVVNPTIWIDTTETAQAASYLHAVVQTRDQVSYALGAAYQDRLRLTADGWRISRRDVADGLAYRIEAIEPADRLPPMDPQLEKLLPHGGTQ